MQVSAGGDSCECLQTVGVSTERVCGAQSQLLCSGTWLYREVFAVQDSTGLSTTQSASHSRIQQHSPFSVASRGCLQTFDLLEMPAPGKHHCRRSG